MRYFVFLSAKIISAFVFALLVILGLNYFNSSLKTKSGAGNAELVTAGARISVLNWNIGYAGLGKESDFIMDGGKSLLPPSKDIVRKNIAGIKNTLKMHPTDFVILQEVSDPDMLNLGIDVLGNVRSSLSAYKWFFSNDIRTRFIPTRWALSHGLASFSRIKANPVKILELPQEPTRISGIVKRQYHMQMLEFLDVNGNEWALLNLHLSAFDEGGNIRIKQLDKVLETAEHLYSDGKHVIVGGDWNMQLAATQFSYTTHKEDLFWLAAFPHEKIKPGWKITVDEKTPTVRSNERPYKKNENYTTIIDGFLVSPNVKTLSVQTIDTEFEFTDHQATIAEFTAKSE